MPEQEQQDAVAKLHGEVAQNRADVRGLTSAVSMLSNDVRDVVKSVGDVTRTVAGLEAKTNTLPITPLIGFGAGVVGLLGIGLSAITVIGALALEPTQHAVAELKESRRDMVETSMPQIREAISRLVVRVDENDKELDTKQAMLFDRLRWEGRIEAGVDSHAKQLETRTSRQDGRQDAEIRALQEILRRVEQTQFDTRRPPGVE